LRYVHSDADEFGSLSSTDNRVPQIITSNQNYADNKWHHVAAVFTGSVMKLYVDGALMGSHPATALPDGIVGFIGKHQTNSLAYIQSADQVIAGYYLDKNFASHISMTIGINAGQVYLQIVSREGTLDALGQPSGTQLMTRSTQSPAGGYADGRWHHVAIASRPQPGNVSQTQWSLYVDGQKVGEVVVPRMASADTWHIADANRKFVGRLSNFRYWRWTGIPLATLNAGYIHSDILTPPKGYLGSGENGLILYLPQRIVYQLGPYDGRVADFRVWGNALGAEQIRFNSQYRLQGIDDNLRYGSRGTLTLFYPLDDGSDSTSVLELIQLRMTPLKNPIGRWSLGSRMPGKSAPAVYPRFEMPESGTLITTPDETNDDTSVTETTSTTTSTPTPTSVGEVVVPTVSLSRFVQTRPITTSNEINRLPNDHWVKALVNRLMGATSGDLLNMSENTCWMGLM